MSSSFRGRECVWQYYSQKNWERMVKNCQAGLIEIRANLDWFYELFRAREDYRIDMFGQSYSEIIPKLKPYSWARVILTPITLICGLWEIYKISLPLSVRAEWAPWVLTIAAFVLWWCVLSHHMAKVAEDPKDFPLIWLYALIFIIFVACFHKYHLLVAAVLAFLMTLLSGNLEYWTLRAFILEKATTEYEFCKQVSGRPAEENECPPLCFLRSISEELTPVPWDVNPEPALTPYAVSTLSSVIFGKRFDVFLSKAVDHVFWVLIGCWAILPYKSVNWPAVVICAVGLTLFCTFICPSWYYADFRQKKELERRSKKKFEMSDKSVIVQWLLFNSVKIMVISGALAYIISLFTRGKVVVNMEGLWF